MSLIGSPIVEENLPDSDDVAKYLRTRTKGRTTGEGTFTAETRPTAAQVTDLIEEAAQEVGSHLGAVDSTLPCAEALRGRIKGAVTLYTCMLIELSYVPEQVGTRSVFDSFEKLYDKRIAVLTDAVADCLGGSGESVGDGGGMPVSSFPCVEIIGRDTNW